MLRARSAVGSIAAACLATSFLLADGVERGFVTWRLDSLERIGDHPVTVIGTPRVVETDHGSAIEFNGATDGLLLETNPIAGLEQFTLEVMFQPDSDGPREQRFLHIEEADTENRALIELRLIDRRWSLDTFLRSGQSAQTLLDLGKAHPASAWHVATLTYDGTTMRHYVNGVPELSAPVAFAPLEVAGRTSIGVRQNRVSWFKGRIHSVRIAPHAETPPIPLWPEGVPGAQPGGGIERMETGRIYNVREPTLTYVPPLGTPTGTAVIVCPGGGYAVLAMANEAAGVAQRLQAAGVSVFILKYRLAEFGHPAPLQDVLRAVRLLRSRAAEFGIRADRIGVMGASAGGHLAASAATLFDSAEGRTGSPLDAISARPDFVALLYPVVTMTSPFAHAGSRRNLLGASPSGGLVERLSLEAQVGAETPPAFLVHTAEDASVPLENSLLFYQALRRAGVPAQLQLYERGPHGFGTRADLGPTSGWIERWFEWMHAHGWLPTPTPARATWARGFEGQRKADLGNGFYLNPIMPGDHPDPSILKDGDDYYMTFSSFDAYPGLVLSHSKDLVNWQPIGPALFRNVGSVWAPDLVKHEGRYYIYFPGIGPYRSNYVVWADDIRGPWSDPIDLKIGRIDPGHAVGPDGKRYLFMSAGYVVELAADGLSVVGEEKKIYDGWKYPEDWIVEGFAQEGPKILQHGGYYHMVLAEGGTAGPPTGHMIVSARSKSIEGPWENSPYNPILRTQSASEAWWSKGHGTLVEGPDRRWYMVYHAYENGFYTLGRQTLLEPIEWTDDGWFRMVGADPARPIAKPGGPAVRHGFAFSDDFTTNKMGIQWSFYKGTDTDRDRYRYEDGSLVLKAKGSSPADCSPLWFVTGDHGYEIEVAIDADPQATAGLLLFYSSRLYAGLGYSATNFFMHSYGLDRPARKPAHVGRALHIRIRNDRHILTMHYSVDGSTWERYDRGMEVSGYHHNVAYEFLSLRPALYAAGQGEVRFRNFRYRALPENATSAGLTPGGKAHVRCSVVAPCPAGASPVSVPTPDLRAARVAAR
jgi:xylan 1,4-beta-xylosidase